MDKKQFELLEELIPNKEKRDNHIKYMESNKFLEKLFYNGTLEMLEPLIDKSQNTLYFCIEDNAEIVANDLEFWNVLVEYICRIEKQKQSLLINFGTKDNVFNKVLSTRFKCPYCLAGAELDERQNHFVCHYSQQFDFPLINLTFHDNQYTNLKAIINSFIENGVKSIFLRNVKLSDENVRFLEELQKLAEENKIVLVAHIKQNSKNLDSLKSLKNLIYIKNKRDENSKKFVHYFENVNGEISKYYTRDLRTCQITYSK